MRRRRQAGPHNRVGRRRTLTVVGIFDFGNKGVNERNVYVALRTAQSLLDLVAASRAVEVKVRDPFAAGDGGADDPRGHRPRRWTAGS